MRVLLLTPALLTIGGIQRYNRLLVRGLDDYLSAVGGELQVLSLNDQPSFEHCELDKAKVSRFNCYSGNRSRFVFDFGQHVRYSDLMIYGLLGFAPLVWLQRLLNRGSQSLLLLYGIEAWSYRSWLHACSVRAMQHLVSISEYTLNMFTEAYAISPTTWRFVLPNPVSPNLLNPNDWPAIAAVPTRPSFRILSVCRLDIPDRPKGIDTVIQALPALVTRFADLKYIIVGDGADRLRLEALVRELGLERQVEFKGYVSDEGLTREFAQCDVYVMPSAKEGFGFVFIEAMAYSKPVVAALAGAVPEVVEHERTGLLVEYGNVAQLVEAITRLLADDKLRHQMGWAGQRAVKKKYSYDVFCDRLASVCEAVDMTRAERRLW